MNRTKIDWPGLTHTWNPIVGCAYGCDYCYARKISNRFKMISEWEKPKFFPGRLNDPYLVNKSAVIFVGSMCDIFSIGVEPYWLWQIIEVCEHNPHHTFMFLTKRPWYYQMYKWPENCWLGTTMEFHGHEERIDFLRWSQRKTFVSVEPIQSEMLPSMFYGIDLVIVGRDTNPGAEIPPAEWIASVIHPNVHYKKSITDIYPQFRNK